MKKFFEEFKNFIAKGNVIDMAVAVVIGGAFNKIITSLVNDIIMPVIGVITGGLNFSDWKIVLKEAVTSLGADGVEIVEKAEVAITFGNTIAVIIDFIIIAFAVFCMVKAINGMHAKAEALRKKEEEEAVVEEPAPAAEPEPSAEEKLLAEIRDLLKEKNA